MVTIRRRPMASRSPNQLLGSPLVAAITALSSQPGVIDP
jgi:hypothetical protein